MTYTYAFEISAILIMIMILFDYQNKKTYLKRETAFFRGTVIVATVEFFFNLLSCVLLIFTEYIPVAYNILVATIFFVMQATMLYAIVLFSFIYMNAHLKWRSPAVIVSTLVYLSNLILSLTTPVTHFYFYFNEQKQYIQGWGANTGYLFYLVNVILCLAYVWPNRKHLLLKDMKVAGCVAVLIGMGFIVQFCFRSVLMLDFSISLVLLYMYMTLENPNDLLDKLTLCGNGYVFKQFIDEKTDSEAPYFVVFLNIRKFRFVNSIHGMESGDQLLRQIGVFLEEAFPDNLIFRIHDDLFAMIVEQSKNILEQDCKQILDKFDTTYWKLPNAKEINVAAVITACEYPLCFRTHSELDKLKNHMTRMQKRTEGKRLLYSEQWMYEECVRKEQVEQILRFALENHTLQTCYQPILNSETNTVESLEALSRLRDDRLGDISPVEFIPVAEETGLIVPLGFYVLENVCRFLKEHVIACPECTVKDIHVNVSALQFSYPKLCDRIGEILDSYSIPGEMIQLELTESTMLQSPELIRAKMNTLIAKGIQFALDDYGTGYSNISYLIQFPFRRIKFDKTIVQSCFENRDAYLILKNEFKILQQLDKIIIVEGIETKEQYEKLSRHGIIYYQGYYFSKPISEKECLEYLKIK